MTDWAGEVSRVERRRALIRGFKTGAYWALAAAAIVAVVMISFSI